ncbi:MAG TPA: ABC transporter substrate-binding protein [Candidatus Limnocylindrales bacterium]|nr:ABC transporter substrate-binding protein [Candidatus Limnocylindrales bacterium]
MDPTTRRNLGALLGVALVVAVVVGVLVFANGGSGGTSRATATPTSTSAGSATATGGASESASPSSSAPASAALTKLTVGLGYIPSVQFAQFYRAQQAGYYRDAGLEVTFQNQIDPQLITLVGQGNVDIGLSDGTSLIPAVSQGIPVRYVATIYAKFPNIVFAKASSGISGPADLKGKRIGTPGQYGSSWIMLQALLSKANLTTSDVTIQEYPDFTQATAVARDQVDAATGFLNNEPIQLAEQGIETTLLTVDDIVPLPGNGLIVGQQTLEAKKDALKAFVAATLRAQDEIAKDPSVGVDASIAEVPDLGKDRDLQAKILDATIAAWSSDYTKAHGTGAIDPDAWTRSIEFMSGLPGGLVPNPVTVEQIISTELLPSP